MNDNSEKSIQVYTTQGKSIYQGNFSNPTKVNLQTENAGYYILKITSNDGRQWMKTIVKN